MTEPEVDMPVDSSKLKVEYFWKLAQRWQFCISILKKSPRGVVFVDHKAIPHKSGATAINTH
jgi:hypothetical protein